MDLRDLRQRLMHFQPVAHGAGALSIEHGRLPRDLVFRGWGPYLRRVLQPPLEFGVRHVMLHNPFGDFDDAAMQWTQQLRMRARHGSGFPDGFVASFLEELAPWTGRFERMWIYLGSVINDAWLDRERTREGRIRISLQSVEGLLDLPNVGIAADQGGLAGRAGRGRWFPGFAKMLLDMGVPVAVEPSVARDADPWLRTEPRLRIFAGEELRGGRRPDLFDEAEHAGEVWRWHTRPWITLNLGADVEFRAVVPFTVTNAIRILREGGRVITGPGHWRREGLVHNMQALLRRINAGR